MRHCIDKTHHTLMVGNVNRCCDFFFSLLESFSWRYFALVEGREGKEMHYTVKFFIIGGPVGVQVATAVPSRAVAKMFGNSDLIILSVEITRKK